MKYWAAIAVPCRCGSGPPGSTRASASFDAVLESQGSLVPGFPKTNPGVGMWEAAGWRGWSPMGAGVARGVGGDDTRRVLLTLTPPVLTHSPSLSASSRTCSDGEKAFGKRQDGEGPVLFR